MYIEIENIFLQYLFMFILAYNCCIITVFVISLISSMIIDHKKTKREKNKKNIEEWENKNE